MTKKYTYIAFISYSTEHDAVISIVVPDIEGCFSAADHVSDVIKNTEESILLSIEELGHVPLPNKMLRYTDQYDYAEFITVEIPEKYYNANT